MGRKRNNKKKDNNNNNQNPKRSEESPKEQSSDEEKRTASDMAQTQSTSEQGKNRRQNKKSGHPKTTQPGEMKNGPGENNLANQRPPSPQGACAQIAQDEQEALRLALEEARTRRPTPQSKSSDETPKERSSDEEKPTTPGNDQAPLKSGQRKNGGQRTNAGQKNKTGRPKANQPSEMRNGEGNNQIAIQRPQSPQGACAQIVLDEHEALCKALDQADINPTDQPKERKMTCKEKRKMFMKTKKQEIKELKAAKKQQRKQQQQQLQQDNNDAQQVIVEDINQDTDQLLQQQLPHQQLLHQQLPHQQLPYQQLLHQQLPHPQLPHQQLPYHQLPYHQLPYQHLPHQQLPYQHLPHQQLLHQQLPQQQLPHQQLPHQQLLQQQLLHQQLPHQQLLHQQLPQQQLPQEQQSLEQVEVRVDVAWLPGMEIPALAIETMQHLSDLVAQNGHLTLTQGEERMIVDDSDFLRISFIRTQLEHYFRSNDRYFRQQRDSNGYIPIDTIRNFNRMTYLRATESDIHAAALRSPILEPSNNGGIRQQEPSWHIIEHPSLLPIPEPYQYLTTMYFGIQLNADDGTISLAREERIVPNMYVLKLVYRFDASSTGCIYGRWKVIFYQG